MPRCRRCKARVRSVEVELRREVDGRTFVARAQARPCAACGDGGVDEALARRFDLRVAAEVARHGTGTALKFIRSVLGLRGRELAALLDVSEYTLSRWERGRRPVPRAVLTVADALVRDALDGRTTMRRQLEACHAPPSGTRRTELSVDEILASHAPE